MFIQGLFDIYRAILLRHCMCVCRTTMVLREFRFLSWDITWYT